MPREDRPRGCLVWLREGRVLQEEGEVGHTGAMSAQGTRHFHLRGHWPQALQGLVILA